MEAVDSHISRWIILFCGFLGNEGKPSGMMRLWNHAHHTVHRNSLNDSTVVLFRTWRADVDALAEWVWRLRPVDGPPDVAAIGHSFGGMTACDFADALGCRGLRTNRLGLCDAVRRHKHFAGNWRAFFPFIPIVIPNTVDHAWEFAQETNWPCGHNIVTKAPTVFHGRHLLPNVTHAYIDDHRVFQAKARKILLGTV